MKKIGFCMNIKLISTIGNCYRIAKIQFPAKRGLGVVQNITMLIESTVFKTSLIKKKKVSKSELDSLNKLLS